MDTLSTQATKKRLEELERELAELEEKRNGLSIRWQNERRHIRNINDIKENLEKAKHEAQTAERNGDYGKVAEIRYGQLVQLSKELENENRELAETQATGKLLTQEVSAEDIAEIVGKWTGIPVHRMLETERTKLLRMEDRIHQRVVGQSEAVVAVSNSIRRSRAGLQDQNRPIGSFIFLGTTGVGKTELARALAEFLFDDEQAMVRIDMSEYMEKHSVARLIGAPPGYVGYEEGGYLTTAIRQKPYSVVLLDEIEKAHPDVFNILLQVLDDGRLTDSQGHVVDFKNTIVLMTSNLGSDYLQEALRTATEDNRDELIMAARPKITALLKKTMRPEFLNRIDEIILFKPLVLSEIKQIAELHLHQLKAKLKSQFDIDLTFTEQALDQLLRVGYDPQFGARPLKRALQKHIGDPLATKLLSGDVQNGSTVVLSADERGQFTFS